MQLQEMKPIIQECLTAFFPALREVFPFLSYVEDYTDVCFEDAIQASLDHYAFFIASP
jgi:hypothetical protein